MVEELFSDILHVSPDGGDDFEPRREGRGVSGEELAQRVPVVRAMVLCLTQPVHQNHAVVSSYFTNTA